MFLDDLFVIQMTAQEMKDLVDFAYTVETNFIKGVFQGRIHRFAIFCDAVSGNVSYKTIKDHRFNEIVSFKKKYAKILQNDRLIEYSVCDGEPQLNIDNIRSKRFSL